MQSITRRSFLALTIAVLAALPFALTGAELALCGSQCVCITWISGASAYVEVRCPAEGTSGWSSGGSTPDGSNGSWGGTGTSQPAPSPLPGMPLDSQTNFYVNGANGKAVTKTRGEKVTDAGTPKGTWVPTACTDLFLHSPLGKTGVELLSGYVVYRDGAGVVDGQGVNRCASGSVAAWTTCCQHDPVVYICPTKFEQMSVNDRANVLIHEAMHVGGQREDTNGSVGPGDPPNTVQINDVVARACN